MNIYKAFWERTNGRQLAWQMLPLLIIIIIEIGTTSLIPYTRKLVIDGLTDYNWIAFLWATSFTLTNSFLLVGAQGFKEWSGQLMSFSLRESLMKTVKKTWIQKKDGHTKVTNPCARLNDDAMLATTKAVKVIMEVIISVCIVLSLLYSIVKWPMLLVAAIIYSGLSILLATVFRKPMIDKNYVYSNAEGHHRIALTKISIQQGDFTSGVRWEELRDAFKKYIAICRNYRLFNAIQSAIMFTLPFWILAPSYFAQDITLGDVTQGVLTFDLLVINSTIWVQLYPEITAVQTAFIRVHEFYKDVHDDEKN